MRNATVLLSAISLLIVSPSHGAAAPEYVNVLEPSVRKAVAQEKEWGKPMAELLYEVRKQRDISVKVGFGFSGDEAGASNLYKVAAEMELAKGVYPRRIAFRTGADVTFKDSELEEQVRSILVNYDYHFLPEVESYGFVERFTDTFMGIDDRYEIGGGLKLEVEDRNFTEVGRKLNTTLATLGKEGKLPMIQKELDSSLPALKQLVEDRAVTIGVRKRHSRLAFGLAATLLMELEEASVETLVDTLDPTGLTVERLGTKAIKVEVPAETQLRGVVRPSMVFHPTDQFWLDAFVYVKYPLRRTRRDDQLDYRVDGAVRARLRLDPHETGEEKVSLTWELRENYDNTPPTIPSDRQAAERSAGRRFHRTENEKKHLAATFKLEVGW